MPGDLLADVKGHGDGVSSAPERAQVIAATVCRQTTLCNQAREVLFNPVEADGLFRILVGDWGRACLRILMKTAPRRRAAIGRFNTAVGPFQRLILSCITTHLQDSNLAAQTVNSILAGTPRGIYRFERLGSRVHPCSSEAFTAPRRNIPHPCPMTCSVPLRW